MKSRAGKDTLVENGGYPAVFKGAELYRALQYGGENYEANMTLNWSLGVDESGKEVIYRDSFITLPTDEDGYPMMKGSKSKLYNRIMVLVGKQFKPEDVGRDFELEYKTPEEWDSPEAWQELPTFEDIRNGADAIPMQILIDGKDAAGTNVYLEIGHAEKPDGSFSERQSIVRASIPAKNKLKPVAIKPISQDEGVEALPV